jgi:hypothetical protein
MYIIKNEEMEIIHPRESGGFYFMRSVKQMIGRQRNGELCKGTLIFVQNVEPHQVNEVKG